MITRRDEGTYETSALPFAAAAAVWASAAGVAGAYVPEAFAAVAREYGDYASIWALYPILEEATRRADWRSQFDGCVRSGLPLGFPKGSYIPPRRAEIVCGRLEWQTSVCTVLAPHADGLHWIVRIEGGRHVTREEAADSTLRALGYEAGVVTVDRAAETEDCAAESVGW
jgi:hypothetical protein